MKVDLFVRIASALCVCCCVIVSRVAQADPVWERHLRVGVPVIPGQLDVVASDEQVAWLIRRAIQRSLIRAQLRDDGTLIPVPDLASGWSSRADLRGWSFQLRMGERFSNGRVVSPDDVVASIRRCSERSVVASPIELALSRSAHTVEDLQGDGVVWLLVRVPQLEASSERQEAIDKMFPPFLRALESCEVVPEELAEIFGELFGHPTIFTGAGPFVVTEYTPGRRVELSLTPEQSQIRTRGPRQIELLPYADSATGVRALQRGELDIFFPADTESFYRGSLDPTIMQERCEGRAFLKRRTVSVPCLNLLDIGSVSVTY